MRSGQRFFPLAGLCVSIFAFAASDSLAEAPAILKIFRPSNAAEKVSDESLMLKAEHGPWLILAQSFEGPEAQAKATELAKELRMKHQLQAFILPKQFDFTQTVVGAGMASDGKQKRMRYATEKKIEGYGVLVGEFDSLENPKVKETVAMVKRLQPQCLNGSETTEPQHSVAAYKKWLRSKSETESDKPNGPMSGAFVTRNPLLPDDFFQAPTVDKFVQNLNKNAEHSLLKSKSRFTVRIATFRGADAVVLENSRAAQQASSEGAGDGLEMAAFQANLAAKTLRQAGIEAYEFHDRNYSIVTVGNFDSLGAETAQGKFAYASDILQTMNEFGGAKEYRPTQYGPMPVPKTLLDVVNYRKIPELLTGSEAEKLRKVKQYSIAFDIDPKPMAVPKVETNKLYINSLLGNR